MDVMASQTPLQPCHTTRTQTRRKWLPDEDEYLKNQIRNYQLAGKPVEWTKVARGLSNRNNKDCRKRWLKIDDRWGQGSWSPDEDERLKRAVSQFQTRWKAVSDHVKSRSPDQCAKRWRNSLDPALMRSDWSVTEDDLLLTAVSRLGRNWKAISETHFPTRSRLDLSNRYTLLTRKRRNELMAVKEEPIVTPFQEMYGQSPGVSSEETSSRHNEPYKWGTSVSPAQSMVVGSPSFSIQSVHSSRPSLSSHSSIEEISKSRWDEVVSSSNGMTSPSVPIATGFIVDHNQTHQQHRRLLSAPSIFHQQSVQTYVPVSQGWSTPKPASIDSISTSPHAGYGMPSMMSVQGVMQTVVDGHVQHQQTSHGIAHSPSSMGQSPRRSTSVSPVRAQSISLPLQIDPSTGSAMVYNALNQGTQVTLLFH